MKKKTIIAILLVAAIAGTMMSGCGKDTKNSAADTLGTVPAADSEIATDVPSLDDTSASNDTQTSGDAQDSADSSAASTKGSLIEDQTFAASFKALGDVTFASYAPDKSADAHADVTFALEKDGSTLATLEGMESSNIRDGKIFSQVEAVSFPDYNSDGYEDIITICSYTSDDTGASTSEARIYQGCADETFLLDKQLTSDTNSALAELTVSGILSFLGVGKGADSAASEEWKLAYIGCLVDDPDIAQWDGFALISIDNDAIPELVEVGNCEAVGCTIVTYANGVANKTVLDRLDFTYIERGSLLCNSDGNMGFYYHVVYEMKDGVLSQIAKGTTDASQPDAPASYIWNDQEVDESTYLSKLHAVYDSDAATAGYDYTHLKNADEMVEAIKNY